MLTRLTQRVLDRALDVELAEHLAMRRAIPLAEARATTVTAAPYKTVLTDIGAVPVTVAGGSQG